MNLLLGSWGSRNSHHELCDSDEEKTTHSFDECLSPRVTEPSWYTCCFYSTTLRVEVYPPVLHGTEGLLARDVIHQQEPHGSSVVSCSDGPVALLSGCVLKRHVRRPGSFIVSSTSQSHRKTNLHNSYSVILSINHRNKNTRRVQREETNVWLGCPVKGRWIINSLAAEANPSCHVLIVATPCKYTRMCALLRGCAFRDRNKF